MYVLWLECMYSLGIYTHLWSTRLPYALQEWILQEIAARNISTRHQPFNIPMSMTGRAPKMLIKWMA